MSKALHIIVLAAGEGKRMRSARPKVLQPLAGRAMLAHVLDTARQLQPAAIHVVYGHGGEQVQHAFGDDDLTWVHQAEQNGTGHAVQVALAGIPADARVLVMFGDVPLISARTLGDFLQGTGEGIGVLTALLPNPAGYGRIVRGSDGAVHSIVEERDADDRQRQIREVNSGMMAGGAGALSAWLERVGSNNDQGEIYLTDVVALARTDGMTVQASMATDASEILGANDRRQLAQLERLYQSRIVGELCDQGAIVADRARVDVRGELSVGQDVFIDIDTVFEGTNELADGVQIGPHCLVRDCRLGPGTRVHSHSVLEGVETEGDCDIGPFARLRPGTRLARRSRIGNFVETKKAEIGEGSKANHLSYVGDATVGREVNIGAGTITCNYDGANKFQTVIGDGAFIGSDTQLVAPVEVEAGATIGAGSTITKTAPADQLSMSRSRQVTVPGWTRPTKKSD